MAGYRHEVLVDLFRHRPQLAAGLLDERVQIGAGDLATLHPGESDLTQPEPLERRADLVLQSAGESVGIIVEVQLERDEEKHYTWPLYLAALHGRLRCPCHLVVLAPDGKVERWARRTITSYQPHHGFRALVIGPGDIPRVTSPEETLRNPELAVLSALAHGESHWGAETAKAVIDAVLDLERGGDLDERRSLFYTDVIMWAVADEVRTQLEAIMKPAGYEYQSPFARKYYGQGKAEGKAEGRTETLQQAVIDLIEARGLTLERDVRDTISACDDGEVLRRWHVRVLTVTSARALIEGDEQ